MGLTPNLKHYLLNVSMIPMRVPRNIQYNAPITPIMSAFKFGMRGKTLTAASASREGPKKASVCSESIYLGALESRDCKPHCSYWSQLYFALRQKVRSCSRLTLLQFIVLVLALSLSLFLSVGHGVHFVVLLSYNTTRSAGTSGHRWQIPYPYFPPVNIRNGSSLLLPFRTSGLHCRSQPVSL